MTTVRRPSRSFWVIWSIAALVGVYAMATPWMSEWSWPAALTGSNETIGTTETEETGLLGFPLWAGLFLAGMVGLFGLGRLARQQRPPGRRTLVLLAAAAFAVGAGGLLGAFVAVGDANTAAAESYYGALSDQEKLDLLSGGAEAVPGGGLNNALLALILAALPLGIMLYHRGPWLVAGIGSVLTLAAFAVPWRAATALHADRIDHHNYLFPVYAEKFSWLLLVGGVASIVIAAFALRSRGPTQTILAIGSVAYLLVLNVAAVWILGEYETGQDDPIEANLADALHVHPRVPVWPEALTLFMGGTLLLLGAVLWQWRVTAWADRQAPSAIARVQAS